MIAVDELRRWVGESTLTTDDRSTLVQIEAHAVDYAERETRRHFGPSETFVEILRARGSPDLWLKEAPTSLTTLEERAEVGDTWTAITDYELRGDRVLRKAGNLFTDGYEYRATYDFGYVAGHEPGDVRQLVMDVVKLWWDSGQVSSVTVSESVGPHSIAQLIGEAETETQRRVKRTIQAWRKPRMA